MWFRMNMAIMIGTNQGTLLIWILFFLNHNDVIWDGSKKGKFWRTIEEKNMRQGIFFRK
jgi:hypothetical protein